MNAREIDTVEEGANYEYRGEKVRKNVCLYVSASPEMTK